MPVGYHVITFSGLVGPRQPAALFDTAFSYVSSKVVTPKDFSAVGDNVTDDTTAVQNMVAGSTSWRFAAGTGYLVTGFTATASTMGRGDRRSVPITISSTGSVNVGGSNVTLENLYVNGPSAAAAINASTTATDVAIRGCDLVTTAAATPNGYAVNVNQAGCSRWSVLGGFYNVYQYGVLFNNGAGGSKGFIVGNNFVTSFQADCINWNSPGTALEDCVAIGNVTNVTNGSGVSAGFSVCFAHVNGGTVVGNVSQRAWLEAHHVEDGSKNLVFIGNVSKACQNHGINMLVDGTNFAQAKAVLVHGNVYEAPSITGTGYGGVRVAWTGSGAIDGCSIIGNLMRNFDYGLYLGSVVRAHADGNVIDNCTYAMRIDTNAVVTGTNRVIGACTALLLASATTANDIRVGKFACDTKPTAIIAKSAPGTTRPGCSVEGFKFPMPSTALANGTNQVNLFPTPTRLSGLLRVIAFNQSSNADYAWYSAWVIYDGTNITLTNTIFEQGGNLSIIAAPAITVSGGQLRIGLSSVGAMTALVECEFDGVYML